MQVRQTSQEPCFKDMIAYVDLDLRMYMIKIFTSRPIRHNHKTFYSQE